MNNIIIRTSSQTPIYQQLYEQISSQILNGLLESDSALPSIRSMAKELRVSIITIKKTWELLEQNGYIYTIKGKGSYVKKNSKATLDKKKIITVKEAIFENVVFGKKIGITKEELLSLVSGIYEEN